MLRSLGERGILAAVDAVAVARPPATSFEVSRTAEERSAYRAGQREVAIDIMARYNLDAVIVVGVPFGHKRPQWILPYGGRLTIDGATHTISAVYS